MEVVRWIRARIGQDALTRHFEGLRAILERRPHCDTHIGFSVFSNQIAAFDCSEDDKRRLFELGIGDDGPPLLLKGKFRHRRMGNVFDPLRFIQRMHKLIYCDVQNNHLAPPRVLEAAKLFLADAFAVDDNGLLRMDEFHSLCSKHNIPLSHGTYSHGLLQHISMEQNSIDVRPLEEFVMSHAVNEADLPADGPLEVLEDRFNEMADHDISKKEFAQAIPGLNPDELPDRCNFDNIRELIAPSSKKAHHLRLQELNPFSNSRRDAPPFRPHIRIQTELKHPPTSALLTHEKQTDKDVPPEDDPWTCYPLIDKKVPAGDVQYIPPTMREKACIRVRGEPDHQPREYRHATKRYLTGEMESNQPDDDDDRLPPTEFGGRVARRKRAEPPRVGDYKEPFGVDETHNVFHRDQKFYDGRQAPIPTPEDKAAGREMAHGWGKVNGIRTYYKDEAEPPYGVMRAPEKVNGKSRGTARKEDQEDILVWKDGEPSSADPKRYPGTGDAPFAINYAGEENDVRNPFGRTGKMSNNKPSDNMHDVLQGQEERLRRLDRSKSASDLEVRRRFQHEREAERAQPEANGRKLSPVTEHPCYTRYADSHKSDHGGTEHNGYYGRIEQNGLPGEPSHKGSSMGSSRHQQSARSLSQSAHSQQQPVSDSAARGKHRAASSKDAPLSNGAPPSNKSETAFAGAPSITVSDRYAAVAEGPLVNTNDAVAKWPEMFGNCLPTVWRSLLVNKLQYFQDEEHLSKDQIRSLFRVTRIPVSHGISLFEQLSSKSDNPNVGRKVNWHHFADELHFRLAPYRSDMVVPSQVLEHPPSTRPQSTENLRRDLFHSPALTRRDATKIGREYKIDSDFPYQPYYYGERSDGVHLRDATEVLHKVRERQAAQPGKEYIRGPPDREPSYQPTWKRPVDERLWSKPSTSSRGSERSHTMDNKAHSRSDANMSCGYRTPSDGPREGKGHPCYNQASPQADKRHRCGAPYHHATNLPAAGEYLLSDRLYNDAADEGLRYNATDHTACYKPTTAGGGVLGDQYRDDASEPRVPPHADKRHQCGIQYRHATNLDSAGVASPRGPPVGQYPFVDHRPPAGFSNRCRRVDNLTGWNGPTSALGALKYN